MHFIVVFSAVWDGQSCAFDDTCARWCIKLYMQANEGTCATSLNGTAGMLRCHHYGRVFNGGASGCTDAATCAYVESMRNECYTVPGIPHPEEDVPDPNGHGCI